MSISLPVPRLPSLPALPEPETLDDLLPGSGDPVRVALGAIAETVDAIAALEAGRPGGDDWIRAREQDRALVTSGKPATRLAAVIAADGKHYATALALASTVSERGRPAIPAGLAEAAERAAGDLLPPLRTVIGALSRALTSKRLADAHTARDQGVVILGGLALRQAVSRWASGEPFEVGSPALPRPLFEAWMDATEELDGVAIEESWRAREARAQGNADFAARVARAAAMS